MATPRTAAARRLSALIQQASEPFFVLDADHAIVFVNPAWEALTGRTAEEVIGLACHRPDTERDGSIEGTAASFCPPSEARTGLGGVAARTLIVRPTGERLWKHVEFLPLHGESIVARGMLGIVRDVPPALLETLSQRHALQLLELRERLRAEQRSVPLIGESAAHRRVLRQVAAAASTRLPIVISGERGTGKRQIARAVHAQGSRAGHGFVVLDAAVLGPERLTETLFRADADESRPILSFEANTTVVLGDLLEIPRDVQARLAASLHEPADDAPRVVFTTSGDVRAARRNETLREDLYFAVTNLLIELPPLRDRLDDLPLLAQFFLERANPRLETPRLAVTAAAIDVLQAYDWPGNLSELARVIEAAAEQARSDLIGPNDLPQAIQGSLGAAYNPPPMPVVTTPLDDTLAQLERRLIERALHSSRHRKSRAADMLGVSRPRLYRRMKELGIDDIAEPGDESAS